MELGGGGEKVKKKRKLFDTLISTHSLKRRGISGKAAKKACEALCVQQQNRAAT